MVTIQAQANGLGKSLNIVGTLSLSSTRRCGVRGGNHPLRILCHCRLAALSWLGLAVGEAG
jgi:hypothetical protein